jgi:hypothetical protein
MNHTEELSYTSITRLADKRKPAMTEISNRLKTHIIAGTGKFPEIQSARPIIYSKIFSDRLTLTDYSIRLHNSSLKDSGGF